MRRIQVLDSHTGGEPTRLVLSGGPYLGGGSLAEQRERFRQEHDAFRRALACEPRGSEAMVGALLLPPSQPNFLCGVIFFNNVGYLGMCGHGTIGLVSSLAYLGRITAGSYAIETPVGVVQTELHPDGLVSVHNVAAYRYLKEVTVQVEGYGAVSGDVAWGGNWFFLTEQSPYPIHSQNIEALTHYAWKVREALSEAGIRGQAGAEIDHIELVSPSPTPGLSARNFVLCPGKAFDRSPCGTGTSAKLACLAQDGKLAPGEVWRQESVIGSVFMASYRQDAQGNIWPTISGRAHPTAESTLLIDPTDALAWGLP